MIGVRRLPADSGQLVEFAARALVLLLTLVAVAAFLDYPLAVSALAVGIGVAIAMTVNERLVIPIIVLLLPLEIGSQYIPVFETEGSAKLDASALSLARMGVIFGALLWTARAPRDWWRQLPPSSLYLPLALLLVISILSLANTDDLRGAAEEVARLSYHLAFFILIPLYVRDRQSLRWAVLAVIASGLVLALIGIFQQLTDTYLWNEGLAARGIRRNATFVDPNIYARFLVVVMMLATATFFGERSRMRYVLVATVVLTVLALPFTSSRSNWVTAAVAMPLLVSILLPVTARVKIGLLALMAIAGGALVAGAAAAEPELSDRLRTLTSGTDALGVRSSLIDAGWHMFLNNPFFGVGLDSFDEAVQGPYSYLLPDNASTFFSHTSVITIMAELGLVGLSVLLLVAYRFGSLCWRLYAGTSVQDRALVAGLVGAAMAIFISSQAEGRLFEEPYLWLVLGLTLALAGIKRREAPTEPAAPADAER